MSVEQKQNKKSIDEIIDEAAEKGARKALLLQRERLDTNHYRAMEELLRAYPRRRRIMEHPEEFEFFKVGRSKDISIAPPPGSGVVDKIEAAEMFTEARKRAYEREMDRLYETEYALAPFKHLPEYPVIQMVYFGQDVNGNDRDPGAKRMTWEEIAEAFESIGVERTITAIRKWRSRLVREMTVMLFGAEGALSVCMHDAKQGRRKGNDERRNTEVEEADGQICPEDRI